MKKFYQTPQTEISTPEFVEELLTLSSPDTGIHDGGEGDDGDDPSSKERDNDDEWGNLW